MFRFLSFPFRVHRKNMAPYSFFLRKNRKNERLFHFILCTRKETKYILQEPKSVKGYKSINMDENKSKNKQM